MDVPTSHSVRIMMPTFSPPQSFFTGYIHYCDSNIIIYVTKFTKGNTAQNKTQDNNKIVGYFGNSSLIEKAYFKNYLHLNLNFITLKLFVNFKKIVSNNSIVMLYDYKEVKYSQIVPEDLDCSEYISTLHTLIQNDNYENEANQPDAQVFQCPRWIASCMSVQHLLCYINLFYWLYSSVKTRKFQIKQMNYVIALLMDILLGYLVLSLIHQYNIELSSILMGILETLVNSLHSLLKWLMGAPAGLKLNNAFNKMLGKYFSYHIQLWWLFLDVSSDKLDLVLHIYKYLGYLGFTFQAAMICDMFCVATFHSYCIYVYAARLFNIQISGLVALMRLFFGRKYNPLRAGIDSCEYTNQELFVGTVAFTILLLLLPTTTMYYAVFTLFRLLSLSVQYTLAKLIHHVHTLPLYVLFLWLIRSPKVAGEVFMETVQSAENSNLVLKLKLQTKSLRELVNHFQPPIHMCEPVEWTNLLSNVITGKQIV